MKFNIIDLKVFLFVMGGEKKYNRSVLFNDIKSYLMLELGLISKEMLAFK